MRMDCPAAELFPGSCFSSSDAVFVTLFCTAVVTAVSGVHNLPLASCLFTGRVTESRRDQEEGGELDSHEAATEPGGDQEQGGGAGLQRELDFFRFSCFPTAELRTLSL